MKSKNIITAILILLTLALTAGVQTVFDACDPMEDGAWMSCHYAQLTVFACGLGMTVLAILSLFLKARRTGMLLQLIILVLAVLAIVIPGHIIPTCMMADMHCNAVMRPAVTALGVMIGIAALLNLFFFAKAGQARRKE